LVSSYAPQAQKIFTFGLLKAIKIVDFLALLGVKMCPKGAEIF
jgi:hypothetical protein